MQSKTHVVLASIKRTSTELGAFQRKIFKIDDHLGIGVSGLISDGRSISRFLRNECLSHRCRPCRNYCHKYQSQCLKGSEKTDLGYKAEISFLVECL